MIKRLLQDGWLLFFVALFISAGPLGSVNAEQRRGESMRFAPYDYSPYQSEPPWSSQPQEQRTAPYNQQQQPPVNTAPQMNRPYEVLPPSGRGYYPYGQSGYGRGYPGGGYGGYPSRGNMWPGSSGGWGGMPWSSPGRNSFNWFGGPGGFPFGW